MTEIEKHDFSSHETGQPHCSVCEQGYPHLCPCGGLIHAEIVKIQDDGFVQLTRCERCEKPEAVG